MSSNFNNLKDLRYLFIHSGWSLNAIEWHQQIVESYRCSGFDMLSFCSTPNPPAPRYTFKTLDRLWKKRDPDVVRLRNTLVEVAADFDVLIHYNGANIHPEWLQDLETFNVYICWDDPESSSQLSEPVAKYFDFAFTGNLACVPLYQSWGIKNCDFLPMCCPEHEYDQMMTVDRILHDDRDIDIVFLGERESPWRRERVEQLNFAFPNAFMRGQGWEGGFLPSDEKLPTYANAKIGWNIHNSIGPVNLRTYGLPANGVMQICDNKCRLGQIFELDKEVIGFDSINECIELTNYYLSHDQERREIAARGFERVMCDYTQEKQWEQLMSTIMPHLELKKHRKLDTPIYQTQAKKKNNAYLFYSLKRTLKKSINRAGLEIRRLESSKRLVGKRASENTVVEIAYQENPEAGPVNWNEKETRMALGGFFEWPNIVALNWAVASLVGSAQRIVELGGGTGCFAYEVSVDPKRSVLCSDLDTMALNWARKNRSRQNIEYVNRLVTPDDGPFDVVVAIDVIEHIDDYRSFLETCIQLAPRAIITTPNKKRNLKSAMASPPEYYQHVREWTAGEFYWVLKSFYQSVALFSMPNVHLPEVVPIEITDTLTPLIAVCEM